MTTRMAISLSLGTVLTLAMPAPSFARPAHKAPAEEKVVLEEDEDTEAETETEGAAEDESTDETKKSGEEKSAKVVLEEEPSPEAEEEAPAHAPASKGPKESDSRSVWLQLGLLQDLTVVSGTDMCTPSSQISGQFTCIRASGSQYHGTPLAGEGGKASGPALGPTRVTLSVALPLGGPWSTGLRLGYAFAGQGPEPDGGKKFLPLLAELQAAYWLSGNAFETRHTGFFLELAGGIAQVDGKASVTVRENTAVPPPVSQLDNPPSQSLDAYHKAGAGFAGAGAGVFLPFNGVSGLVADVRASALFPTSGFALSLGVSAALGR